MEFEFVTPSQVIYLETILGIIRTGIIKAHPKLGRQSSEPKKNQELAHQFDRAGRITDPVVRCQKEHQRASGFGKEDLYFFLLDDYDTLVFYCECKRLNSKSGHEEYVQGKHTSSGSPSGGIQRFKLGIHGEPHRLRENGIIGYVESRSVEYWLRTINMNLPRIYPEDGELEPRSGYPNEFVSKHRYECEDATGEFIMHHFLIDLTSNK